MDGNNGMYGNDSTAGNNGTTENNASSGKHEIRRKMKLARNRLSDAEVCRNTKAIYDNAVRAGIFDGVNLVMLYSPTRNEPDMYIFHDMLKKYDKKITTAYPRVCGDRKHMEFYMVEDYGRELRGGYMGIMEPEDYGDNMISPGRYFEKNGQDKKAVIIVPGLVFDIYGNRTGYGGGFYDRYLEAYRNENRLVKAAACYEFQVMGERILHEGHDVTMDYIITERNVYRTGK